jgi:hypothetical protein
VAGAFSGSQGKLKSVSTVAFRQALLSPLPVISNVFLGILFTVYVWALVYV